MSFVAIFLIVAFGIKLFGGDSPPNIVRRKSMYFTLKESKITGWWVARENDKLTFVNICSKEQLPDDLVVVGFLKDSYPDLARSENHVKKVTREGVITSKGSFYPFYEAHALYLTFLYNANEDNAVIASNWELNENTMTADIMQDGKITKNVTFDFDSYYSNMDILGYSDKLMSNVVVSAFSRRGVCMTLYIPRNIKHAMMMYADFEDDLEKEKYINYVRNFVK